MRSKKNRKQFFVEPDEFPGEETQPYVFFQWWNEQSKSLMKQEDEPVLEKSAPPSNPQKKGFFRKIIAGIFSL